MEEMIPRDYQRMLINTALKENSIIFLPTGSGKTFVAVCLAKELSKTAFSQTYSNGGKITIMLVNTVALVNQHKKNFENNTPFTVGGYTGDMNVDYWSMDKWLEQYEQNQVLIMTAQIFNNCINSGFIDLEKVNLIIFDECHQAVDAHPMRQIMINFQNIRNKPHVIGLTATLLNGNVKSSQVLDSVKTLEVTFHAKVITADELENVLGFSTNPQEHLIRYAGKAPLEVEITACQILEILAEKIRNIKMENPSRTSRGGITLPLLDGSKGYKHYARLTLDAIVHIKMLGIAGGKIALQSYIVHLECDKQCCTDSTTMTLLCGMITIFSKIIKCFEKAMSHVPLEARIFTFSTPKVLKLMQILQEYKKVSTLELSGIIFVQRKNTAIFLYHILLELIQRVKNLDYIRPDFIIGINANPLKCTREALYMSKMKNNVIEKFNRREINILIASNVIEEGIDIPQCTFVLKFDTPTNYREYVQSKGRARHKSSLYYIMVQEADFETFTRQYIQYQKTEEELNMYLIGQNENRSMPTNDDIEDMYKEFPPYYTKGPGSACITMLSAIQLLTMYCQSLSSDAYITYEPIWYLEKVTVSKDSILYRVHVELPIICPILYSIKGSCLPTKRDAKRSAAFGACMLLHKYGEFDDNLIPKVKKVDEKAIEYLFKHWPDKMEEDIKQTRKVYKKKVPLAIEPPIHPNTNLYLHIIDLSPEMYLLDNEKIIKDHYASDLTYGILTASPLPPLCQFTTYVTSGQIDVNLRVNTDKIQLDQQQIFEIKHFHHMVFNSILLILKKFLYMEDDGKNMLVVPVRKSRNQIDFDVIRDNKQIKETFNKPAYENIANLKVNSEEYLGKIIVPWYRQEEVQYVVLEVCEYTSADSTFPNEEFKSYADYFQEKYNLYTFNRSLPLLKVKAISSRLNCLKPRGETVKRRKDDLFKQMQLHLIPEHCIKQDFPGCLWFQAKLLPTILHRICYLLRAEDLRSLIATEAKLGIASSTEWRPLELDMNLINYSPLVKHPEKSKVDMEEIIDEQPEEKYVQPMIVNKEFTKRVIDSEYPWQPEEEPKDILRTSNLTELDLSYYVKFINESIANTTLKDDLPKQYVLSQKKLAIDYNQHFEKRPIALLKPRNDPKGPELHIIYQTLMTAKCNDVVNLERLETLGDSFLKLVASLYIYIKFPKYTEGQSTQLKGRLISNKNLYYLAKLKRLPEYIKMTDLSPQSEWLPPSFCVPKIARELIENRDININSLFHVIIPQDEQISGIVSAETIAVIEKQKEIVEDHPEKNAFSSMCSYLCQHMIPDKTLADVCEALIGAYFQTSGFQGGLKFMEWLNIFPKSENITNLLNFALPNPIVNPNAKLDFCLPNFMAQQVENIIGYKFKNKAYLLQALTHGSYTVNRVTMSYERLEFIGDAVLDFLITAHIYETCDKLTPGELTDLRSALVNNETFAAFVVRLRLYKYLFAFNSTLNYQVSKFVIYQQQKKFEINDEVLILLNDNDLKIAEKADVPKVLGDLFESIAGAVFLDSGMDLEVVWDVFYKIMWKEIDAFSKNVPKNPIRLLYETLAPLEPKFHSVIQLKNGNVKVKVEFMLKGSMTEVHGFGDNKKTAKIAAAKMALKLLRHL